MTHRMVLIEMATYLHSFLCSINIATNIECQVAPGRIDKALLTECSSMQSTTIMEGRHIYTFRNLSSTRKHITSDITCQRSLQNFR